MTTADIKCFMFIGFEVVLFVLNDMFIKDVGL